MRWLAAALSLSGASSMAIVSLDPLGHAGLAPRHRPSTRVEWDARTDGGLEASAHAASHLSAQAILPRPPAAAGLLRDDGNSEPLIHSNVPQRYVWEALCRLRTFTSEEATFCVLPDSTFYDEEDDVPIDCAHEGEYASRLLR